MAPELLMKEVSDNKILQMLREEKEMKLSGGLNSCHLIRIIWRGLVNDRKHIP